MSVLQGSEAVSEQHQLQVQEPQQQEAQQGEVYSAEDGGLILIQSEDGSIQVCHALSRLVTRTLTYRHAHSRLP